MAKTKATAPEADPIMTFGTRLPRSVNQELDRLVERLDRRKGELVREAIQDLLRKHGRRGARGA